ncbi:hypothetical protein V6N11_079236 [Hibiscus sabdariffa]|uniref:Uncharacterized protein n=1 Tax=Hibiscus sabdariffa TaxID=183260 RepID=A0ABR2RV27_9ROSI
MFPKKSIPAAVAVNLAGEMGKQIDLHGVDVGADLLSVYSYVESLVLLDEEVNVPSESDVDHSSDSDELSGRREWCGIGLYAWFSKVMGFRKNGKVLLHMHNAKMASLDLNSQQMETSLDLNSEQTELHVVDDMTHLLSVRSYVESLVLLDKAVNVHNESDVNHPIDSSGGESDLA